MASKALLPRVDFLGLGLGVMLAGVLGFVMLNASEKRHEWQPSGEAIAARNILFSDRSDGGISVRDASTGQMIGEIAPGEGGFVRGGFSEVVGGDSEIVLEFLWRNFCNRNLYFIQQGDKVRDGFFVGLDTGLDFFKVFIIGERLLPLQAA